MKPLQGICVLDLSRVLAGPFCTMRLADLGARVIKVESKDGDTTRRFGPPFVAGESPYFMSFNRGKESIVLDLKSDSGRAFVDRVLTSADVVIENFRPGVMSRLGMSDDELKSRYPRLIRAGITGFGPLSSRRAEPAFDLAIQAESGLMDMNGPEGGETCRVPISIADLAAGSSAAEGIVAALFARERDGFASRVDVALLDSLVALFGYQSQSTLMTGDDPVKMGHRHPNLAPYQGYATADGMLVLAVAMDVQWQRLVQIEGMPESLARDEWRENKDRVLDRKSLEAALTPAFKKETTATWTERLKAADVPFGPVLTVGQMLDALDADKSSFLKSYDHSVLGPVRMTSSPLVWNGEQRGGTDLAPPAHGEHTLALISEFAKNDEEADRWRQELCGAGS